MRAGKAVRLLFAMVAGLLAGPADFWNAKEPAAWSQDEIRQLLEESPWATVSRATSGPHLRMHVASAELMQQAEAFERQAQRYRVEPGVTFEDYQAMLREGRYIVLAVHMKDGLALSDQTEVKSLERDSLLHVGRRAFKLITHFPPSTGDPYLRYIFPREVKLRDKSLMFDIYIPGAIYPQRHVEFDLRQMTWHGKPAY